MNILKALFVAACVAATSTAARADEIVLRADAPIVDVTINGKPARMLVDTFLPDMMVLNPDTQTRLGVRPVPMLNGRAVFDDASVRAHIARPRIVFANGKSSRALTGLFGAPWSGIAGVDGAMGPGVLPYDRVRIILRDGAGGTVRTHRLPDPEAWMFDSPLAGETARVSFRPSMQESMLNRAAARHLDERRLLALTGAVERRDFFLGLSTTIQPATTDERVAGYAIGAVIARTDAPLVGAEDVDVIRVTADAGRPQQLTVTLGRAALAGCYEMIWERASGTLSLRCDY
ncbi:MAG: hypothetical protein IV086_13940 [Hyphomonadaceae bacterium]|nr:MAG: hypothetical protein FD160_3556 [Caulobacteraceae bacterium]MBT9446798.1 hypothetical protein [Hyphomonadaceae bacterium]